MRPMRLLSVALLALTLVACGTNPVTGKRELQFVSEQQEISIGQQQYAPARQAQGGDYIVDPELTAYVQSVGTRLAAVADRDLPYEFVVLNSSVPNAWAMPGGKIAVNRGLLYALSNEAELAAVLGHEIVHAAARHGAQSMERGLLLQGVTLAIGLGAQNSDYANLIVGGAQLGAQLITTRYGRDAESEADLYGMRYMQRAGYNPAAAVTLQQTFVKLNDERQSGFLAGLFASHPPSSARVAANQQALAELGAGGTLGVESYARETGRLKATQAGYQAYDAGVAALAAGDGAKAAELARQAIAVEPREPRFQELLGDVALSQKKYDDALEHYAAAIRLQPDYFKPLVQSGIALVNSGRQTEAEDYFKRANALLPTAPGHYFLGEIAAARGDTNTALQHYQLAAGSDSAIGRAAAERHVKLDLPRNPGAYLRAAPSADSRGNLYAVLQNPTPLRVDRVRLRLQRLDPKSGRIVAQSAALTVSGSLAAGAQTSVRVSGARLATRDELKLYRVVVEAARIAD